MNELIEKMDEVINKMPANYSTDMLLTEIKSSVNVSNIIKLYELGIITKEDLSKNRLILSYMTRLGFSIDNLCKD